MLANLEYKVQFDIHYVCYYYYVDCIIDTVYLSTLSIHIHILMLYKYYIYIYITYNYNY
jgi:hypothetical protein